MSQSWQPMPDIGAERLSVIGQDVLAHNRFGHNFSTMESSADALLDHAASVAGGAIAAVMAEHSDLVGLDLLEGLDPQQREDMARAYMLQMTAEKLMDIEIGTTFKDERARLTVRGEGVVRHKAPTQRPRGHFVRGKRSELDPGTTIEGYIVNFDSYPQKGCWLVLSHIWSQSAIYGLVDPNDGQPRIELDILSKQPR